MSFEELEKILTKDIKDESRINNIIGFIKCCKAMGKSPDETINYFYGKYTNSKERFMNQVHKSTLGEKETKVKYTLYRLDRDSYTSFLAKGELVLADMIGKYVPVVSYIISLKFNDTIEELAKIICDSYNGNAYANIHVISKKAHPQIDTNYPHKTCCISDIIEIEKDDSKSILLIEPSGFFKIDRFLFNKLKYKEV